MPNNTTPVTLPILSLHYPTPDLDVDDLADAPAAPDTDVDEPDEPQQAELPTGPSHVAARGTPRTKDQLASARQFIAAAGRVKFDRGRATLKAVWMSVAYYASLGAGPKRVCYAEVETLADRALVSERTVRTHLAALAGHGLIQTDHRTGGHAPTHWDVSEVSLHVRGGKDCRGGRQELPGRAARIADEVRDVRSAPTEQDVHLASKQQPDGASAPPAAAQKNRAATTKNTQPNTEGPELTQTPEPTQTLAPAKTDPGGVTRGGITDKQIAFLCLLADRVGAEHDEEAWRAADPKRVQAQIKAALPFKDLKGQHTHAAVEETHPQEFGIHCAMSYKACSQRCACGAMRYAFVTRAGPIAGERENTWLLTGHIFECLKWAAPMPFSEVKARADAAEAEEGDAAEAEEGDAAHAEEGDAAHAEEEAREADRIEKARVAAEATVKAWVQSPRRPRIPVQDTPHKSRPMTHDEKNKAWLMDQYPEEWGRNR